jgi:methylenetetrahydrofolate reductase (NADPH)
VVTDLCQRLIDAKVPGVHFYTLNNAAATKAICERLGA